MLLNVYRESSTVTVVFDDCPHLFLWCPLSCPCLPLEHCCLILSSWKSESCAALSAPFHCCRVSGAIGWLVAGFAVIGCAAGRPTSPGNFLGWGLMRSWWGGGCWLGLACNDSVKIKQSQTSEHVKHTYQNQKYYYECYQFIKHTSRIGNAN